METKTPKFDYSDIHWQNNGKIKLCIIVGTRPEIIRLADWDTVKTNKFASRAIAYLLNCENEKLPKEIMVAFE